MKDLPSKKHYCYKIHTSSTKSSVSPFYRQPSSTAFMDYPSFFTRNLCEKLRENGDFILLNKSLVPYNKLP